MKRRISSLCAVGAILLVFSPTPTRAQDTSPGENLGGYDALASAVAISFQPFLPAFVSTGDVPFEASFALSNSRVKAGGGAFGRGALVWPGSAAANMGPILGVAFQQPELGALVPPWPLMVEADQNTGETKSGAPPAIAMTARGLPDRGEGDVRTADVDVPRIIHIEHIASTSSSVVLDASVSSHARVTLHGVSLLAGYITAEQIRSVSRTTSLGDSASAGGDVDIVGLKIGGVDVSVTDEGFQVGGMPPDAQALPGAGGKPAPGQSPEEHVNAVLEALGARITLFKGVGARQGGQAERMQPGVVISVDNPVGGQGPIPPGRFDIILAATSSSSFASSPFSADISGGGGVAPGGAVPGLDAADSPSASIGGGPSLEETALADAGEELADTAAGPLGTPPDIGDAQPSDYRFSGLPIGLVIALVAAAVIVSRYLRNFMSSLIVGAGSRDKQTEDA